MSTCARPTCPNKATRRRNRGYCEKHYNVAPLRGYVDPADSRERLTLLRSRGVTRAMIADSGVSRFGQHCIETNARIRRLTEAAVFAIPIPPPVPSNAPVDATGTRRRIQGLVALGWPQSMIAAELGTKQNAVSAMTRRDYVTSASAISVRKLFAQWSMTLGPSEISRTRAKAVGWLPPLAWDDIDDPNEIPDLGRDGYASFMDRYTELVEMGLSHTQIAPRMGIRYESLARGLARHGVEIPESVWSLAWKHGELTA